LDQRAARAGACEAEAERLEMLLADLDDHLHNEEASLAKWQQQIQAEESTIAHESSLTGDLETELRQTRKRLTELTVRARALAEETRAAEEWLQEATHQAANEEQAVQAHQTSLEAAVVCLTELHKQIAADKTHHLEQMRRSAHLQNEAVASKAQVD